MDNLTNDKIEIIDNYMKSLFDGLTNLLIEPMKYSLFSKGKRLRPLIMLLLAEEMDVPTEKILPFCAAVEMIHTYSLIHDDLPCLDDDDFRRGVLSCHKVHGEAFALLAGDGLLNYAHEIMLKNIEEKHEIKAAIALSNYAGITGMIAGQALDVFAEENQISKQQLHYVHTNKTGKLLTACFIVPAILSGKNDAEVQKYYNIGMNYGLSFQVLDDILDATSTDDVLGKPVGSDTKNSKTTYISLYGVEKSKEEYERLKTQCLTDIATEYTKDSDFYKFVLNTFDRIH